MAEMTDEEAEYWDELYTRTTPKLSGKPGYYTTHMMPLIKEASLIEVDKVTAGWLRAKAEATHKTPAEIIGALVREKILVSAQ
jgi:hypothetical protein